MSELNKALPELPQAFMRAHDIQTWGACDVYTADQMRDYALRALASSEPGEVGVGVDTTEDGTHVGVRQGDTIIYSQFHAHPPTAATHQVPRCPKCGYTNEDCRNLMDHHLCGEPEPPAVSQSQWEVTDAMIETIGSALYTYWKTVSATTKAAYRKKIRAALIESLQRPKMTTQPEQVREVDEAMVERACEACWGDMSMFTNHVARTHRYQMHAALTAALRSPQA